MDEIADVILTGLKQIPTPKGMVYHGMKASEDSFKGFGEAYFSTVANGEIKGWKKHLQMTLNLIVIHGEIEFTIYDDRKESPTYGKTQRVALSRENNYKRLTIPPNVWFAFKGKSNGENTLLNIASIEHNPEEAETQSLNAFNITL